MVSDEGYMSISEAADYCGVDRGTIARWVRQRQVSFQENDGGREVLIPRKEVEILRDVHSLDDVIREAAKVAGLQINERVQVRMNTLLMALHGKTVLELYDAGGPKAWGIRVKVEEIT